MPRLFAIAVLAGLLAFSGTIHAEDAESASARFCVVRVNDAAVRQAYGGQAWRIAGDNFRIPGLPAIVFTPIGGQWTIDAERQLVSYVGPYPHTYLDKGHWVAEPWSSRIVAITYGGGLSVLRPGTDRFEVFGESANRRNYFGTIQLLPRRKLTIVTHKGVPLIVGEKTLQPWLTEGELATHGIRGISRLYDAPSLAATIIVDIDSRIHVLADDGHWQQIGSLDNKDYGPLFEALDANAAVIFGLKSVELIKKNDGSPHDYTAARLLTTRANGADKHYSKSQLFHQILTFASGDGLFDFHARWRRLGPRGFEDVPGGDIGLSQPQLFPFGLIRDLPTLGKTLIEGKDGLYLYDGQALKPVLDGEHERIGNLPRVFDLPSIKRVLLSTRTGIFELTVEGKLVARPMPFPAAGLPLTALVDWPEAGVAIVSTRQGLFVLDEHLGVSRFYGGELVDIDWGFFSPGTNPSTGELILVGKRGLFLVVDSLRNPEACRHARK